MVHRGDRVVSYDGEELGKVSGVAGATPWFTVDSATERRWFPRWEVYTADHGEVRLYRGAERT